MSKPTLEITVDFTEEFFNTVKQFKKDAVLVGIPQEEAPREDDAQINNATLLAINEFGSPMNNIPARPVMAIGIRNAQDAIAEQFKQAAQSGSQSQWLVYMERAGIIAANAIKKAINAQEGFDGPAESTIRAREAKGFQGKKALIVTGQMRNAITHVVNPSGNVQVNSRLRNVANGGE